MKHIKHILILGSLFFFSLNSIAQIDTNLVNQYFEKALAFEKAKQLDSAIFYYNKTSDFSLELPVNYRIWGIEKHLICLNYMATVYINKWKLEQALEITDSVIKMSNLLNEDSTIYLANAYNSRGLINYYSSQLDEALSDWNKCYSIRKKHYGEDNLSIASSFNNIGLIYDIKGEYAKALEFYNKSLKLRLKHLGEINQDVANSYNNIGAVHHEKDELNQAIFYYKKCYEIRNKLFGEKHPLIAASYNNLGLAYSDKLEFEKALEYHYKSLSIKKDLLGENNNDVAASYNNIGIVHQRKADFENALDFFNKSLNIRLDVLGEKNIQTAMIYHNIGVTYDDKGEHKLALDYFQKCLAIRIELLGNKHPRIATTLINIGNAYKGMKDNENAKKYYLESLDILIEIFGNKHTDLAGLYNNLGDISFEYAQRDIRALENGLKYYHLALKSCLVEFNDSANIEKAPIISVYYDYSELIRSLRQKAKILTARFNLSLKCNDLVLALNHYQAADTVIGLTRVKITTLSDKLALGESAGEVYIGAVQVCLQLAELSDKKQAEEYKQLAFHFSEKNKSQVLLQALSGQEAQKFAGIPDTLLEKEHNLKIDINFYEQKLAEGLDSITERNFRDKLFKANRQYEELIANFETSFPEYFNLKYNTTNPSVKDLQKLLDAKTALLSYFVGDSTIYIFTITNKKFDVQQVTKINNLEDTIRYFRYGLTKFSDRMYDIYRRTGYLLYKQLFPEFLTSNKQIENLVIIPDGALATIPFEALLTDNSGGLNGDDFKKYPFLINRYNVSYSYSANLFYRTFPKEKQKQPELTNLNDWLALAPVFDDKTEQGVMLATRELQKQLNYLQSDTLNVRGRLLTGDYITPLPGTESETQAIIKQYENRNLKAQALLHQSANEQFIKSGGLEKYKVLHFATHGFVNSEKPELSGILLAQDSTDNQDGILYSGEIYNLKLNADLVVLSACETGLGKINKGEGIIGLTRALLYAGSKNIIVSLWQVSDESTSDLMIDFYNNLLSTNNESFSDPLRKAKLQLISEGKFAHPFYWSPFILVGK